MILLKDVINYTLHTGRDLFDDFNNLNKHQALAELEQPNEVGLILSTILEGLDIIGIDLDDTLLEDLMVPTMDFSKDEDERDFIPDKYDTLINTINGFKEKRDVDKLITSLILSKMINNKIILNAPYDMAVRALNAAAEEQEQQFKQRR